MVKGQEAISSSGHFECRSMWERHSVVLCACCLVNTPSTKAVWMPSMALGFFNCQQFHIPSKHPTEGILSFMESYECVSKLLDGILVLFFCRFFVLFACFHWAEIHPSLWSGCMSRPLFDAGGMHHLNRATPAALPPQKLLMFRWPVLMISLPSLQVICPSTSRWWSTSFAVRIESNW